MVMNAHVNLVGKAQTVKKVRKIFTKKDRMGNTLYYWLTYIALLRISIIIQILMIVQANLAYMETVLTELTVINVHVNLVGKAQTVKKVRNSLHRLIFYQENEMIGCIW